MANQGRQTANAHGPAGPGLNPANPFFGLLPREFIGRVKDPFVYNIIFNTIGGTTTAQATSNIQNDSDFVWTQAAVVVTANDNTTFTNAANVPCVIELSDSASGRALQDQATHVSAWFGTAQLPFYLQAPKIFRSGGQITARLQNFLGSALIVRLSFHGFKVFQMSAG